MRRKLYLSTLVSLILFATLAVNACHTEKEPSIFFPPRLTSITTYNLVTNKETNVEPVVTVQARTTHAPQFEPMASEKNFLEFEHNTTLCWNGNRRDRVTYQIIDINTTPTEDITNILGTTDVVTAAVPANVLFSYGDARYVNKEGLSEEEKKLQQQIGPKLWLDALYPEEITVGKIRLRFFNGATTFVGDGPEANPDKRVDIYITPGTSPVVTNLAYGKLSDYVQIDDGGAQALIAVDTGNIPNFVDYTQNPVFVDPLTLVGNDNIVLLSPTDVNTPANSEAGVHAFAHPAEPTADTVETCGEGVSITE